MNRLSIEEMKKATGGTTEDADRYILELFEKYKVDDTTVLSDMMTLEELEKLWQQLKKK